MQSLRSHSRLWIWTMTSRDLWITVGKILHAMAKQSHLAWRLLSEDMIFMKNNSENEMNYQTVSPPGPNGVWGIQFWSSHTFWHTLLFSVFIFSYCDTCGSILINYFVSWRFCTFIIFFFIAKFTSKTILINNYKFQEACEVARKSESPFLFKLPVSFRSSHSWPENRNNQSYT